MTNEVIEDVVEVPEITPSQDELGNDTTDWKALAEERHALAVKNQGIAKRYKTKAEKPPKEVPPASPVEPKEPKSGELDYGQMALLRQEGIKGPGETALFKEIMSETGKGVLDVLDSSYFKSRLTEFREAEESRGAIPKGKNRSGQTGITDIDVSIARFRETGQLPDDFKTRTEVVNKMIEAERGPTVGFSQSKK